MDHDGTGVSALLGLDGFVVRAYRVLEPLAAQQLDLVHRERWIHMGANTTQWKVPARYRRDHDASSVEAQSRGLCHSTPSPNIRPSRRASLSVSGWIPR
jgi:hypothetical protein